MAHESPLLARHRLAEALIEPYGPPDAGVEVVATFGEFDAEYAAVRKGCALLDLPQRGVIRVTGSDRLDFLNRMLTQKLDDLAPCHVRRSFWLNRKGRIDADMRVVAVEDAVWIDLDVLSVQRAITALDGFLFSEDVHTADESDRVHRLALHGPTAIELVRTISEPASGVPVADLSPGRVSVVTIGPCEVIIWREDTAGETGLELLIPASHVADVYNRLVETGRPNENAGAIRLRESGWHAYNVARIEAGTPVYLLDFGPDSLPNETGVLRDRVDFSKGCYLGQEIVARIESHGGPKQCLMALRAESVIEFKGAPEAGPVQPMTGSYVLPDTEGDPVGAVTSSAISPMLGDVPICFAMVRKEHAEPGATVLIEVAQHRLRATVQDSLVFWRRP